MYKCISSLCLLVLFVAVNAFGFKGNTIANSATKGEQEKMKNKMVVEIWSDIMCPFCYIGKRKFEAALEQFPNKEFIQLEWKSFQLDPTIPESVDADKNVYQYLAERKGFSYEQSVKMHGNVTQMAAQVGLQYNFDIAKIANSFKAHRLIQFAKAKDLGDKIEERLFLAYFVQGRNVADDAVLTELGKDIGLTDADVKEALTNDEYAYRVKQDIQEAEQIRVTGVPFFVFDRKYAVSGAQQPELFLQTLERSYAEWRKANPVQPIEVLEGAACKPDGKCD